MDALCLRRAQFTGCLVRSQRDLFHTPQDKGSVWYICIIKLALRVLYLSLSRTICCNIPAVRAARPISNTYYTVCALVRSKRAVGYNKCVYVYTGARIINYKLVCVITEHVILAHSAKLLANSWAHEGWLVKLNSPLRSLSAHTHTLSHRHTHTQNAAAPLPASNEIPI
jgi:hypothetical protein